MGSDLPDFATNVQWWANDWGTQRLAAGADADAIIINLCYHFMKRLVAGGSVQQRRIGW